MSTFARRGAWLTTVWYAVTLVLMLAFPRYSWLVFVAWLVAVAFASLVAFVGLCALGADRGSALGTATFAVGVLAFGCS
jgi:hypothetical protein